MKRSGSDDQQTAYRTEPPLTEELLECAVKNFLGSSYADALSVENGLLIIQRVGIWPQDLEMLAERLTEAEVFLQNKKTNAEKSRETDLQARAKVSGLALED